MYRCTLLGQLKSTDLLVTIDFVFSGDFGHSWSDNLQTLSLEWVLIIDKVSLGNIWVTTRATNNTLPGLVGQKTKRTDDYCYGYRLNAGSDQARCWHSWIVKHNCQLCPILPPLGLPITSDDHYKIYGGKLSFLIAVIIFLFLLQSLHFFQFSASSYVLV